MALPKAAWPQAVVLSNMTYRVRSAGTGHGQESTTAELQYWGEVVQRGQ